ncbi:MAG TPA: aminopeptidase [Solirubrobacteraceae bacterium]|nr:aminopeptidase [Solirubrobacteraceae bacterium]
MMSGRAHPEGPAYQVPREYLERYADVLVNFALGGGAGIRPGEVVHVISRESARPFYAELCRAVWRAGGHVLGDYRPDDGPELNLTRDFYELAGPGQHAFFPALYWRGVVEQIDHSVYIRCDADPHALRDVEPERVLTHERSFGPLVEWETAKERAGLFTWTIGLYGTEAMAAEAGLSLEDYWGQIIKACFLDHPDPKASWRAVATRLDACTAALDSLPIDRMHLRGEDVDLWLTLGEQRRWIGGGGRNIPSFEIFTSPDWRGTEGWIRFSEPLYIYGSLITGIELTFRNGSVTRARAAQNEELLLEMLATERADRVGEFSLTDARLSPISHFMAETLFDENMGGPFGNTHIAVGKSIQQCYAGNPGELSLGDWQRLGFNDSVIHTDIVSTTDREVTAVMRDGTRQTIYGGGQFQLD